MSFLKSMLALLLVFVSAVFAQAQQNPDVVYSSSIHSVRFHMYGDQEAMPLYKVNSGDRLELHFDDMDNRTKQYYYTYQLCDYNWQPVNMSTFDYVKGFTQQRITNYRFSSIAYTRYVHYQAILPEANSVPSRSGNYLLKVFLDGDTSKTVFTRGMLVLDGGKASVGAQVIQPFGSQYFNSHQRVKFSVNLKGFTSFDASQQIKVKVLQNNRWDNAQGGIPPTFVRGNVLEYNNEANFVFPGGKEWRWLDLRSFRLLSDRIDSSQDKKTSVDLFVRPDIDRKAQRYVYYKDLDGLYQATTYESVNPYWQGDYATVHFKFINPGMDAFAGKDLYLIGQLTDYQLNENSKMKFNPEKGLYEGQLYLKQGYYDYGYLLVDQQDPNNKTELEGNYWETENSYTILVYYRSFTDQSEQLIGVARVNSRVDRPGFSF